MKENFLNLIKGIQKTFQAMANIILNIERLKTLPEYQEKTKMSTPTIPIPHLISSYRQYNKTRKRN